MLFSLRLTVGTPTGSGGRGVFGEEPVDLIASSSASISFAPDEYRWFGFFSKAFNNTASTAGLINGLMLRGRGGACEMCCNAVLAGDGSLNGTAPTSNS